jgi:hypothetical protein
MATSGLQAVTENVIDSKTQNNEMFTAHDITLELRNRGHRASHHEVKEYVHDYYSRGEMGIAYTRSTITVPLGGTPYLYHRQVDDPSQYQNIRGQGQTPTPSTHTVAIPDLLSSITSIVDNTLIASSDLSATGRKADARNTLSVPVNLVKAAGFDIGDCVYVSVVGNVLEITKNPSGNDGRKYTVDKGQQIRITQAALEEIGMGNAGDTYDLSQQADKIFVKKSAA